MPVQRQTRHIVHHVVVQAVLGNARLKDRDDVGVIELAGNLDLTLETALGRLGGIEAFPQYFNGDFALRAMLQRSVHYTLTAPADFVQNVVTWEIVRWWQNM